LVPVIMAAVFQTDGGSDQFDIHSLVRHNRYDDVKALISQGRAETDAHDDFSNTLLAVACQNGLKRMAKLIMRYFFCVLFGHYPR
jgi:hypothetical protein